VLMRRLLCQGRFMTDQRVYIATRQVRHIATWITDLDNDPTDNAGRYRAICGSQAVADWPVVGDAPRLLFGADPDNSDGRWTLHVCTHCIREADTIMHAATT
jgi:hypothetical protein